MGPAGNRSRRPEATIQAKKAPSVRVDEAKSWGDCPRMERGIAPSSGNAAHILQMPPYGVNQPDVPGPKPNFFTWCTHNLLI